MREKVECYKWHLPSYSRFKMAVEEDEKSASFARNFR